MGRWGTAAVVVVVAHAAGAALALMSPPEEDTADAAGPILMELAPLTVAVPVDSIDIAPGLLMEEATLTLQTAEEVKTLDDVPVVEEAPLAPEPEVVLPAGKPTEVVETEEKPEEEQAVKDVPSASEAAPQTTAPVRVEAEPTLAPPQPASGATRKSAQSDVTWQKALMAHLAKHKRYPAGARAKGTTGTATVTFVIDRSGKVIQSRLAKSSGSELLDEEAVAVLERASPLPPPSAETQDGVIELNLPIQFRLR